VNDNFHLESLGNPAGKGSLFFDPISRRTAASDLECALSIVSRMPAVCRVTRALLIQASVTPRTAMFYLNYAQFQTLARLSVYREFAANLTFFFRDKTRAGLLRGCDLPW
jgi:hypothetical protein